jgi:hypothetical protein
MGSGWRPRANGAVRAVDSARSASVHQDAAESNRADARPASLLSAPSQRRPPHKVRRVTGHTENLRLPLGFPWIYADGRRALIHNVGYLYTSRLRKVFDSQRLT